MDMFDQIFVAFWGLMALVAVMSVVLWAKNRGSVSFRYQFMGGLLIVVFCLALSVVGPFEVWS